MEAPECPLCEKKHWSTEPCAARAPTRRSAAAKSERQPASGFDPVVVAKAVPFYLKHLENSKIGQREYRKRLKAGTVVPRKKTKKRKNKP